MKFIKTFEQMDALTIPDEIVEGCKIYYQGSKYEVLEVNDAVIKVKSLRSDEETFINSTQLKQYGYKIAEG